METQSAMKDYPVIFLDIDGVLNSHGPPGTDGGMHADKACYLGNTLVETGAKIVLSSAWRYMGWGPNSVYGQCLQGAHRYWCELIINSTIGATPLEDNGPEERDVTIRRWIDANWEPIRWVAIDDLQCISRLGYEHCVITDGAKGMTPDNMWELIKKLKG